MKPVLRRYQCEAVDSVILGWSEGIRRPALVLSTGTGKTVIMSELVSRMVRERDMRPVILVHRDELVGQTVRKLRDTDPGLSIGVVKASRHEIKADVVVASVQTLIRRLGKGKRGVPADRFNLIIVDECHHASAKSYIAILEHFGAMDPARDTLCLGVTATLERADGIPLGHVWEAVVYTYDTRQAIAEGFLVAPRAKRAVLEDLDLSKVRNIGGDWSDGDLGVKMVRSGARIAESILEHARDGQGGIRRGIVFSPTVDCAFNWAADFRAAGIRSEVVIGETPIPERQLIYKRTHEHDNDMIVSVMCLTEGFDLPSVEVAVIGRPTKSLPLYTQMVGRILRPSPETGKTSALVLDVCGVMNDRLRTLIDLGLPKACGCDCDCAFEHLCPQRCRCPRTISGKLKRPCIVCARAKGWSSPCPHYDTATRHVFGCQHNCEGIGPRGVHPEDEAPDPFLDEPKMGVPLSIDESDVELEEVDLFNGIRKAVKPRGRSPWLKTKGGIPFLPASQAFPNTIFLWAENDGTWTVGVKPKVGRAEMLERGLPFLLAVERALAEYPTGNHARQKLSGYVSQAQVDLLGRFGYGADLGGLTRQEATDMISVEIASRSLDPK